MVKPIPHTASLSKRDAVNIALMAQDITNIKSEVQDINSTLKSEFVKKEEFDPIRNLVYGFVGLVLIGVIGALIALVIIHPQPLQPSVSVTAPK